MADIDLGTALVDGGLSFAGGAVQRIAWNQKNELFGFLTTGGLLVGGLFLGTMSKRPGDLMDTVSRAAFYSGATIAGWVGLEKVVYNKKPGRAALRDGESAALNAARQWSLSSREQVAARAEIRDPVGNDGNMKVTRL